MKSPDIHITSFDIQNEMDLMLAHRRGMQFARFSGITLSEQTRFATAVSEICRNGLEYAGQASIRFSISKTSDQMTLVALIKDEGKGIEGLNEILARVPGQHRGRGLGIVYAKKLADGFQITTHSRGTSITIQKNIPGKTPINNLIVQGWMKHLEKEPAISAYEELKMRNVQLLELAEQLRANSEMMEKQVEEISLLNDRLSKSNSRMKEFTFAISHDLKTPLSSLKLSAEFLQNYSSDSEADQYHQILSRSVNRLDKTIHGLMDILELQNTAIQVVKILSFQDVFQNACEEYAAEITTLQARIDTDFSEAPKIRYVEAYLMSVLHNLLSNSIKYRNPSKQLLVRLSTRNAGKKIVLEFEDNGLGMDLEKVNKKLFMPFHRFSRHADGKGIGLYLIKGMVENNGGSVTVNSRPGEGTKFIFELYPYDEKF